MVEVAEDDRDTEKRSVAPYFSHIDFGSAQFLSSLSSNRADLCALRNDCILSMKIVEGAAF